MGNVSKGMIFDKLKNPTKKIITPAILCEPRSQLELFSDFVTPSLLLEITKETNAIVRLEMVIKFLLNGFIATRQDPFKVSRKTFNPILCEIFRCKWDLSAERDQNAHFESIRPAEEDLYDKFGMRKRNNDHTVTFIGEQVSHNPPISSFYIEGENITA